MATIAECPKCHKSVLLCRGHVRFDEEGDYPTVIGTRDIEIFDETQLANHRFWQVPSEKDGTVRFITHERMAGYLQDFFLHLYRDFQPPVEVLPEIPCPAGMEILDFQRDGVYDMWRRIKAGKNILLGDEMGLGKTIQVLLLVNMMQYKRVLVVCPNSLKLNWKREAETWLTDKHDLEVAGTSWCGMSDFTIINYEALRQWGVPLAREAWDLVVLDEAHYCKNPSTQRTKMAFALNGITMIMLTGTPIVNYPYEIFPLANRLDNKVWGDIAKFEYEFTYRGSRYARNLAVLQKRLRDSIMIRRLKKDVLTQLPKKRRQVIEFSSEGFEELLAEEKKAWAAKDNDFNNVDAINEIMNTMMKEGSDDADFAKIIENLKYNKRYYFEQIALIRHKVALAKVPLVLEHLDTVLDWIPGIKPDNDAPKVVVFGHHRDVLQKIADHYKGGCVLVMGGEDITKRDAKVQKFQHDPECRVFVGGMAVNKEGINLTASAHVVFAEMDWVPGTLTQAEDRCHRIGQEADKVLVQHLVLENSLDAHMAKTVINKQRQIEKALDKKPKEAA